MFDWLVGVLVRERAVPVEAVSVFVGEMPGWIVAILLSLLWVPPGADSMDFDNSSCVVGNVNAAGRGRETGVTDTGGGAVANGIST